MVRSRDTKFLGWQRNVEGETGLAQEEELSLSLSRPLSVFFSGPATHNNPEQEAQ
jgi:hypothetical protein